MHAIFWSACAIAGVSLALLFHYSDPVPRLGFAIVALAVAAWMHPSFLERNLSRARNALLAVVVSGVFGGIGYGSWFMAAVPLFVFAAIMFAVLLVHDVQTIGQDFTGPLSGEPRQELAMSEALGLYFITAALLISVAGLAS
jgi:hypothetical protein